MKRLYRSKQDQRLGGVIGGLAEYINYDSNLLRLIFAIGILLSGVFPGVVVYFIAWFIVPEAPVVLPERATAAPAAEETVVEESGENPLAEK